MNVDFNNLRVQAVYSYDRLAKDLNAAIYRGEDEYIMWKGRLVNVANCVIIPAEDIKKEMDDLRSLIATIACVYEPGDDNFKMVKPDDQPMVVFAPEEGE
jgi:hypothetical protein